jgi:hypothetical protein
MRSHLVLYDFDPIRVRKERVARIHRLPTSVARDDEAAVNTAVEGEVDGVDLVLSDTVMPAGQRLEHPVPTGKFLPYLKVSRPLRGTGGSMPVALIDSERILIVREGRTRMGRYGAVEVMQF